jgi:hypothetical protein
MAYFLCAILSVFMLLNLETNQFKNVSNNKKIICSSKSYNFVFFILFIYWTCLIGLQFEVGTDYNSYRKIFTTGSFYRGNYEILFNQFSNFLMRNNIHYQFGFIVIALINFFCFFLFLRNIELSNNNIFVFLFFFVSTSFYNQTNGLRQYTAAFLFLFSIWYVYKKKIIPYILLIILASLIHRSALILLPIYFLAKLRLSRRFLLYFLIIAFIISFFSIDKLFLLIIQNLEIFSIYEGLLYREVINSSRIINLITKYIFIPFYLLSLIYYKNLSRKNKFFFRIGFISYSIKIMFLSTYFVRRLSIYFDILLIFPLYYFILYLFENKDNKIDINTRKLILFIFFIFTISMLFTKTIIFPRAEYDYKSILSIYLN